MRLSTRSRYGTRALLELGLHYGEGLITLKDISQSQQIPLRYLEQITTILVAGELVRSIRGAKGGVSLAKPPEEIKIIEVMRILEGPIGPVECIGHPGGCTRSDSCAVRDIWSEMEKALSKVLETRTLRDLIERQRVKERTV